MKKNKFLLLIPFALFILTILAVGRNLKKPFVGIHDWNGARYGNIARNYLRYGFFTMKTGQVENSGEEVPANFVFYTHYPPLLPILISISYRIFGVNEMATRFVPLLATAFALVLIFMIGRTIFRWEVGLAASLLILATPMIRYFGKNPVHEPLAMTFSLVAFLGAAKILAGKRVGWILIFAGLTATSLTNWSGIFLAVSLTIILFRKITVRRLAAIWLTVLFFFGLHFLQIYITTGFFGGGGIFAAFWQRTALGGEAILTPFTLLGFLNQIRLWASTLFTLSLISTSLFGIYFLARQGRDSQKVFLLGLLVYGAGYPLAFPNATFIHSYFIYGMIPFLGLAAAFAIYSIAKTEVVRIALVFIIFMLIWFERKPYLASLEKSQGDILAYKIGSEMKTRIPRKDLVLITPENYGASRLPILAFYSDRRITLDAKSEYNWKVAVNNDNTFYTLSQ